MRVGLTALLTDRVPNVQTIKRLVARSGAASERNDRREPVDGVEETVMLRAGVLQQTRMDEAARPDATFKNVVLPARTTRQACRRAKRRQWPTSIETVLPYLVYLATHNG